MKTLLHRYAHNTIASKTKRMLHCFKEATAIFFSNPNYNMVKDTVVDEVQGRKQRKTVIQDAIKNYVETFQM